MTAFSLGLDFAVEVNRYFLENDYGDLSFFFFFCFELSNKYGLIFNVEQETIVVKVNLASNHTNHGAIIRIYGVQTTCCCS